MLTRNLLCVPGSVASSSFISNARRRATAFTCAHPEGVRFHGSGVKYRAWQPHAVEDGSKVPCCVHVCHDAGSNLAIGQLLDRAGGSVCHLSSSSAGAWQPRSDALSVSEHHFAAGKSGGGQHITPRFAPLERARRSGNSHPMSRAPTALDSLGKQILRFPR